MKEISIEMVCRQPEQRADSVVPKKGVNYTHGLEELPGRGRGKRLKDIKGPPEMDEVMSPSSPVQDPCGSHACTQFCPSQFWVWQGALRSIRTDTLCITLLWGQLG